eukprot:gene17492-biopygen20382
MREVSLSISAVRTPRAAGQLRRQRREPQGTRRAHRPLRVGGLAVIPHSAVARTQGPAAAGKVGGPGTARPGEDRADRPEATLVVALHRPGAAQRIPGGPLVGLGTGPAGRHAAYPYA